MIPSRKWERNFWLLLVILVSCPCLVLLGLTLDYENAPDPTQTPPYVYNATYSQGTYTLVPSSTPTGQNYYSPTMNLYTTQDIATRSVIMTATRAAQYDRLTELAVTRQPLSAYETEQAILAITRTAIALTLTP